MKEKQFEKPSTSKCETIQQVNHLPPFGLDKCKDLFVLPEPHRATCQPLQHETSLLLVSM